jgi:hypothetical protein
MKPQPLIPLADDLVPPFRLRLFTIHVTILAILAGACISAFVSDSMITMIESCADSLEYTYDSPLSAICVRAAPTGLTIIWFMYLAWVFHVIYARDPVPPDEHDEWLSDAKQKR